MYCPISELSISVCIYRKIQLINIYKKHLTICCQRSSVKEGRLKKQLTKGMDLPNVT